MKTFFIGLKPFPEFGISSDLFAVVNEKNIPHDAWSSEKILAKSKKEAIKKFGFRIIVWGCLEDHAANNFQPYIMTDERYKECEGWFRRYEPAFPGLEFKLNICIH